MEPGPPTEGSVHNMSLTTEVIEDLKNIAQNSPDQEERQSAKGALEEIERNKKGKAPETPGQRYLREQRELTQSGSSFDHVSKRLDAALEEGRAQRLAKLYPGNVPATPKVTITPQQRADDLPAPNKPQCTGNAGDFPIFKRTLDTYLEHYGLSHYANQSSDPFSSSRASTALRIIRETVATNQHFSKHTRLAPLMERQQLEQLVNAAEDAHEAYETILTYFRHTLSDTRKQSLLQKFHRSTQGTRDTYTFLRDMQTQVTELRRVGITIPDETAINNIIACANPDLAFSTKLSRKLIGNNLTDIIQDLLDDADHLEAPSTRTLPAPRRDAATPARSPARRATSAERLRRTYRIDLRGLCHGCLSPDHRQFDVRDGAYICPNTQQRFEDGKLPHPGQPLPQKQRAFRVMAQSPHQDIPADGEEEDERPDSTDNAGNASDGGHLTTDDDAEDDDLPAPPSFRPPRTFRVNTRAAAFTMALKPAAIDPMPGKVLTRALWDSCSDCNATGDRSLFLTALRPSGALLEGVNPTPVEPLIGTVEYCLATESGTTETIRTSMFYVSGLPVTVLSEHGTKEEHGHVLAKSPPTVTVLDRMATVTAQFNMPTEGPKSAAFTIAMAAADKQHVEAINSLTAKTPVTWHGTQINASDVDRKGRSYRNRRCFVGRGLKRAPRTHKMSQEMHAAPRKYVGRRFRAVFQESDGNCSVGEGVVVDYDPNTGWWRGRYDEDVEGLNVQEEDFNARELMRWMDEYDTAHNLHALDRGWLSIPGHEDYALNDEWFAQMEQDAGHAFTHEACGRDDGKNVRCASHDNM